MVEQRFAVVKTERQLEKMVSHERLRVRDCSERMRSKRSKGQESYYIGSRGEANTQMNGVYEWETIECSRVLR